MTFATLLIAAALTPAGRSTDLSSSEPKSLSSTQVASPDWMPDEWKDLGRFEVSGRVESRGGSIEANELATGCITKVMVGFNEPFQRTSNGSRSSMLSVPPKEIPGDVISGEPIGFRGKYGRGSAKIRRQERRISILGTDGYSIRMTVGMQAGENQTIQDADAQRAEAVFRECLSRAAMRRLNASDPVEISGRSVRTMRREPDGQRYLSLGDLCAALGASLQWNGGAFRAAVTRAGTTAVIPLAASEVKVGDEWKALPALVLYDGQTIWVPVEMSELLMTE